LSAKQIWQSSSINTGVEEPAGTKTVGASREESGNRWWCQPNNAAWRRIAKMARSAGPRGAVADLDLPVQSLEANLNRTSR
jgi:hypothetical protein